MLQHNDIDSEYRKKSMLQQNDVGSEYKRSYNITISVVIIWKMRCSNITV